MSKIIEGLRAYSPKQSEIVGTLDVLTDCTPVASFILDGHGVAVEWSSSGSDRPDVGDAVSINGETVYQDRSGDLWPEDSLTLTNAAGDVVRVGKPMEPLPAPDAAKAYATAVVIELLANRSSESAPDWTQTAQEQGWTDAGKLELMTEFLRDAGLMKAFSGFAAEHADFEKVMSADPRPPRISRRVP